MEKNLLTVRELNEKDILFLADYRFNADAAYLLSRGVETTKMPTRKNFTAMLQAQLALPYKEKAYVLVSEANGKPIGHSNLNPLQYANYACMRLHIWDAKDCKKGFGEDIIKLSLPYLFYKFYA